MSQNVFTDQVAAAKTAATYRRSYRTKAAAAYIGVSLATFYRLRAADPTFPAPVRLGPNSRSYLVDDLDRWLEGRQTRITRH